MRELEAALADIDAPLFTCPGVDRAEPESMQGADIVRGEAMVRSVVIYCVDLRQLQCLRFGRVHKTLSARLQQHLQRLHDPINFRRCVVVSQPDAQHPFFVEAKVLGKLKRIVMTGPYVDPLSRESPRECRGAMAGMGDRDCRYALCRRMSLRDASYLNVRYRQEPLD